MKISRHYLDLYHKKRPDRLAKGDGGFTVVGNVFVHPTARVHASAVVGPNVSLGPHVEVGEGARIKESIVLERSVVMNHAGLVTNSNYIPLTFQNQGSV